MNAMRCYFLKNGVIRGVEVVHAVSDEVAVEEAMRLYEKRKDEFGGIELWHGTRLVHQHPPDARRSA